MVRTNRFKLSLYPNSSNNLFFDLLEDPNEEINRVKDPQYQEIISSLKNKITQFYKTYQVIGKQGNSSQLPDYNPHVAWNHYKENQV
jgi:hypothetical protein